MIFIRRRWNREARDAGATLSLPIAIALTIFVLIVSVIAGCGRGQDGGQGGGGSEAPEDSWETPGGRWHPIRRGALTQEQVEEMKRLKSIGYLAGSSQAPEEWGVTVYDSSRAWDGLNFYTSGHQPGAVLMDMRGNVLHEWKHSFMDAWRAGPGGELPKSSKGSGFWRRAHLFENGDVLAIFDGHGLVKIDRDSNLKWARFGGFHHDLDVVDDGRIFLLERQPHIIEQINPEHPILEEFIVVLDADGKELHRVSQLSAFMNSEYVGLLEGMEKSGDVFHTNTIEVLDGRLAGSSPAFRAGNVLICIRELDNIAIIDMESEEVVWGTEGPWLKQHQPTVLNNGNMLIFDNGGSRGASRILEFDPFTKKIEWVYKGDAERLFHSPQCGSNDRLPNGNTLISETDRGRAFEVTPGGETVWEFINPAQAGDKGQYIASLFEVLRIRPDYVGSWLDVSASRTDRS